MLVGSAWGVVRLRLRILGPALGPGGGGMDGSGRGHGVTSVDSVSATLRSAGY